MEHDSSQGHKNHDLHAFCSMLKDPQHSLLDLSTAVSPTASVAVEVDDHPDNCAIHEINLILQEPGAVAESLIDC